jgi:hypothetical protein
MRVPRIRFAPVLDLACIAVFVLVGRGRHEVTEGVGWFLRVMWPLCVGFFGVALLTRLYTPAGAVWLRLAVTLLGGIAIAQVLRGSLQDRPWVSIFTAIALVFLALTTYGWRLIAALVARRRAPAA